VSAEDPIPELRTDRLLLRGIQPEDVDAYHQRLFADPEVMRFLPGGEPIPRERLDGVVERTRDHWEQHGYGVWVVCDAADGEVIGQCGLRLIDEVSETELLYAFARATWGRGIGTEAATAAVAFGFDRTSLDRIVAYAVQDNVASTRIMAKLGMRFEAEERLWDLDLVRYAVARKAWASISASDRSSTTLPRRAR
jgi:ribosomal-protein-alanine N-acetyltransferase